MGKDDDNYIDNGLYGDDCLFGEGPVCDLFDKRKEEGEHFSERPIGDDSQDGICCVN